MNDLTGYRQEIDEVDEQILDLLSKRQAIVIKMAHLKKASKVSAYQPQRHDFVISKQKASAIEHGLDPKLVAGIWQSLMHEAIRLQTQILEKKP